MAHIWNAASARPTSLRLRGRDESRLSMLPRPWSRLSITFVAAKSACSGELGDKGWWFWLVNPCLITASALGSTERCAPARGCPSGGGVGAGSACGGAGAAQRPWLRRRGADGTPDGRASRVAARSSRAAAGPVAGSAVVPGGERARARTADPTRASPSPPRREGTPPPAAGAVARVGAAAAGAAAGGPPGWADTSEGPPRRGRPPWEA
eukprot:CAMPEP_0196639428 /NCGR_PEP_ID=MMETSP1085-20130531/2020_1 /TAXON_ID=41879 ORGANISM="Pycnococcus sp, Strain CCMP1998" /NCGR_SAMPLE_ID=MMETSP1085 /ASSEMBLY_ACC=CAM_ASM_000807 /LENGTH=208 /DNA_ID=CAMNT_0041968463 /DNA_START=163 /DNA_END=790 /DNA_ORIENTATION=-